MTDQQFNTFIAEIASEKIGHNPSNNVNRCNSYDPEHLSDLSMFNLDLNHFCFLIARPDLVLPYSTGADELNYQCAILIIKTTDNTQPNIDEVINQAEIMALKLWAYFRELEQTNGIFLFDKVKIAKQPFKIEKLKGLSEDSAGVELIFTLQELIYYRYYLDDATWQ